MIEATINNESFLNELGGPACFNIAIKVINLLTFSTPEEAEKRIKLATKLLKKIKLIERDLIPQNEVLDQLHQNLVSHSELPSKAYLKFLA